MPIDDFDGFVDAITRLVDDPERCAEMGRAAIERCEAQFSLEASTTRFQQVLDELVTTTRPTS